MTVQSKPQRARVIKVLEPRFGNVSRFNIDIQSPEQHSLVPGKHGKDLGNPLGKSCPKPPATELCSP